MQFICQPKRSGVRREKSVMLHTLGQKFCNGLKQALARLSWGFTLLEVSFPLMPKHSNPVPHRGALYRSSENIRQAQPGCRVGPFLDGKRGQKNRTLPARVSRRVLAHNVLLRC